MAEQVRDVARWLLSSLPRGWCISDYRTEHGMARPEPVLHLHLTEPDMGWGTWITAYGAAEIALLKGQATRYVDQCMASTLPTPHQA